MVGYLSLRGNFKPVQKTLNECNVVAMSTALNEPIKNPSVSGRIFYYISLSFAG